MCIEVASDAGTRILLDLGMPLYDDAGADYPRDTPQRPTRELIAEKVLPDVAGLYPGDAAEPGIVAIVLTHAHADHFGLAHHARPEIPVYGSIGTIALIRVREVFFPSADQPANLRELPTYEPLAIGGITVTAIPVDHAAPDSCALLVEGDGQRLLYSGDLRAHGRTGYRFERLLTDERVRDVDVLLLEGTTLGAQSGSHGHSSEYDVEDRLVDLAHTTPDSLVAVVCSGQNLDRLVSCYKAAIRSDRQLVIDPYQAYVLRTLTALSASIPQFEWDRVRVAFAPHQVQRLKDAELMPLVLEMRDRAHVTTDELAENPGGFLMSCRSGFGVTKVFDKIGAEKVALVWSQWSGYWKRDGCAMREWAEKDGGEVRFIHSGGHAGPEDLKRLSDAVAAEATVFVHAEASARPDECPVGEVSDMLLDARPAL